MLKSQRVWATNTRFLNDPTEGDYAAAVVREVLQEQKSHYAPSLFNSVCRGIDKMLNYYEKDDDEYIACFCENGDLLSQWRGYGAIGNGYALGFAAKHVGMTDRPSTIPPKPVLRRVIYDQKKQRDLVKRFVRLMLDGEIIRRRRRRHIKPLDYNDYGWYFFSWHLVELVICFKDPAYAEEREWRVIQLGRNAQGDKSVKTDFRTSRCGIVEFVELDFTNTEGKYKGRLPVNVIRYGPTLDPKVTERSLRLLFKEKGYADFVAIRRSEIPFSG